MRSISIDISKKIDRAYVDVIHGVKATADLLSVPFFIIGATARDFIMEYFYNIRVPRMTNDIDIGIRISSWKKFNELLDTLIKTGKFIKLKEKHRLQCGNILVDVLPFGGVAGKDLRISWPPDNEVTMSVLGFNEVFEHSTLVKLSSTPELEVKIPTLPGLAIMKLLSWKDAYPGRQRDAEDLLFIMMNYEHAGNFDRLYKRELYLLEEEDFDNKIAGIKLLGKDIRALCGENTFRHIRKILNKETNIKSDYNLVLQMMGSGAEYTFEKILNMLLKLKEGITG